MTDHIMHECENQGIAFVFCGEDDCPACVVEKMAEENAALRDDLVAAGNGDLSVRLQEVRAERDAVLAKLDEAKSGRVITTGALKLPAARILEAEAARDRAVAALAELVACKDLKDRVEYDETSCPVSEEGWELDREYRKRKPLAWKAARDVMKEATP
jgi:hypothetical protein